MKFSAEETWAKQFLNLIGYNAVFARVSCPKPAPVDCP